MRVYANLCAGCREKLEKLYHLRDEPVPFEKVAQCRLCGQGHYYTRVSYDPVVDNVKGGARDDCFG